MDTVAWELDYVTGISGDGRKAIGNGNGAYGSRPCPSRGAVPVGAAALLLLRRPARGLGLTSGNRPNSSHLGARIMRLANPTFCGVVVLLCTILSAPADAQPAAPSLWQVPFNASDVSADGSVVVGGIYTGKGVPPAAVRWTPSTGTQVLPALPSDQSWANGVSADGRVVVGSVGWGAYIGYGSDRPFRWTASTGMISLSDREPQDGLHTSANAASADGSVVVGDSLFNVGKAPVYGPAFRWTPSAGLDVIPGMSAATAVSDDGSAVVGSRYSNGPPGSVAVAEAVRWTAGGGATPIGMLPGHDFSQATDVSADGSVVVGVSFLRGTGGGSDFRLFRWTAAGGMADLGSIEPGPARNLGVATTSDGSIVVANRLGADFEPEPFVWDEAHGIRDLRDVLGAYGIDIGDWRAGYVTGISADGSTFIGNGTFPNTGWVAIVPEPAGLALLSLAAAALLRRRHTRAGRSACTLMPVTNRALWASVVLAWIATPEVHADVTFQRLDFYPSDLSADGSVVTGTHSVSKGRAEAVLWTASGGTVNLGYLPGHVWSTSRGISPDGALVVGLSGDYSSNEDRLFKWTPSTGMADLGYADFGYPIYQPGDVVDVDPGIASALRNVSADGEVVVGQFLPVDGNVYRAARWTKSTGWIDLKAGGDALSSHASAVSADGSVVVGQAYDITDNAEAFRWTSSTGAVRLGRLGGAKYSEAVDVSADGSVVVGNDYWFGNDYRSSPFIWDGEHGTRRLQDVLEGLGADLTGVELGWVTAISADGRSFVGSNGLGRGWIATVPEPAGPALLTVAAAALLRRRRRQTRAGRTACVAIAAAGCCAVACCAPALAVVSSNGGADPPFSGVDVNRHVGADRFYSNGYTGSRATAGVVGGSHVWSGHETLAHVTTFIKHPDITVPHIVGGLDHMTGVGFVLGGRPGGRNPLPWQRGIAHGAELWTGAVASYVPPEGGFGFVAESLHYAYHTMLQGGVEGRTADVVSSSWSMSGERNNSVRYGRILDAMANQSGKVLVMAAGNSGQTESPQPAPFASNFNNITAASLGGDTLSPPYSYRSSFSSYGPSDFWNPATGSIVPRAVASIDLSAPGENLTVAGYPGTTYYGPDGGTSYAAPIIAGGAALVVDAGRALFPDNPHATDGRVVKSVLQTSATKLPGWDNGQLRRNNVWTTTQGLDYYTGAGALNLDRAFTQYTAGTTDVPGLGGGAVQPVGWDFGEVAQDAPSDYFFSAPLLRNTRLTATLNWFMDNSYEMATDTLVDRSLDNLDLEVWRVTPGADVADVLLAQSTSTYNNVEHLHLLLTDTADYMLRVKWTGEVFDTVNDANRELFALSWSGTPVPEPGAMLLLAVASPVLAGGRGRRRRSM